MCQSVERVELQGTASTAPAARRSPRAGLQIHGVPDVGKDEQLALDQARELFAFSFAESWSSAPWITV